MFDTDTYVSNMDKLNDNIRRRKTENKKAFSKRMRLEGQNKFAEIIKKRKKSQAKLKSGCIKDREGKKKV